MVPPPPAGATSAAASRVDGGRAQKEHRNRGYINRLIANVKEHIEAEHKEEIRLLEAEFSRTMDADRRNALRDRSFRKRRRRHQQIEKDRTDKIIAKEIELNLDRFCRDGRVLRGADGRFCFVERIGAELKLLGGDHEMGELRIGEGVRFQGDAASRAMLRRLDSEWDSGDSSREPSRRPSLSDKQTKGDVPKAGSAAAQEKNDAAVSKTEAGKNKEGEHKAPEGGEHQEGQKILTKENEDASKSPKEKKSAGDNVDDSPPRKMGTLEDPISSRTDHSPSSYSKRREEGKTPKPELWDRFESDEEEGIQAISSAQLAVALPEGFPEGDMEEEEVAAIVKRARKEIVGSALERHKAWQEVYAARDLELLKKPARRRLVFGESDYVAEVERAKRKKEDRVASLGADAGGSGGVSPGRQRDEEEGLPRGQAALGGASAAGANHDGGGML